MAQDFRFYEDNVCVPSDYTSVPIAFQTNARLAHEGLKRGEFVELPMGERLKDYDAHPDEGMAWVVKHFDTRKWQSFGADDSHGRAAGLVVARKCPEFEMLEGRDDLAVIVDLRVRPDARRKGLGRALMQHALDWCVDHGCAEAKVETQDINVDACRFYSAMGFHVTEVNLHAYPLDMDEVQVIWRRILTKRDHRFPA